VLDVDARPSDAIALAVRLGASIFVNEDVMDEAAYVPEEKETGEKEFLFKSDSGELERLKQELKKAVEKEEYEKAARLRDEIRKLESRS